MTARLAMTRNGKGESCKHGCVPLDATTHRSSSSAHPARPRAAAIRTIMTKTKTTNDGLSLLVGTLVLCPFGQHAC